MTAIEEMAGMDVLCSDKTGTLTLNKLNVDKNLIEVKTYDSFTVEDSWRLFLFFCPCIYISPVSSLLPPCP